VQDKEIAVHCTACGHGNRASSRFCARCGRSLGDVCAACGTRNEPEENFCGNCGASLGPTASHAAGFIGRAPVPSSVAPVGERRQLTVLFCDLVGSTPLSQQLDPEDWRDVVAQYHQAAAGAVARFGGHVAQYLGDGVLVYFGWPDAREDDPERAVRAGLAILDAMDPAKVAVATPDGTRLAVRVGMHTGPVVVTDSGQVFGETPNVAARVQGAAEPDTVLVSAATQRLVAGIFVVEDRGPQTLKGIRDPMGLYRIVQPSGVRSRLDVAAGRLTPFVGRELELGTLLDRWERVAEGEGQNVLLVGEAGVGKSRLVYQFRERLTAVPNSWLECRATPYTEGTPFYPIIDLVQQGLAFTPEDTAADKIEKLEREATRIGHPLPEVVPLVAEFVGLAAPDTYPPLGLSPDVQRRKTIEALAAWVLALAEAQPLVMLVEDLHWIDPSSLELLGRIMAQTATARALLVFTTRPDFRPPWPTRSNLTTLQLARLTKRQAREMVLGVGGRTLPPEMLDTLVARADGVPLYLEELTKGVAEPDVARGVDAIPATLADSLMARLDRLSAAKEVAQRAAVLGREFPYALLAAVAQMDEDGLRRELARLVDAEILFARGEPPNATYIFKHALVQEAAYASLLKRTRQPLHGRVVDVLVERFPEQVASEPEIVARHAEAAGRLDDAIAYYAAAGAQAQARSAHDEAIGQLQKAIALVAQLPAGAGRDAREVALQMALGGSFVAVRGYAHADTEAAYERARALCVGSGAARERAEALAGLSVLYTTRGDVQRGCVLAEQVLTVAEETRDRSLLLLGLRYAATAEHFQGRFASSLAHAERASALYDPARDYVHAFRYGDDQGVGALAFAAWNLFYLGQPDRALARAEDAVALARRLGHAFSLAFALFWEAALHWFRGDEAAQQRVAAEAIALSEAQGFPLWHGLGRMFHGYARVTAGEPEAGLAEVMDGLAQAAGTGNNAGAPIILVWLAEAQRAAGRDVEALHTVEDALAASQGGQHFFEADLHRLKGALLLHTEPGRTPDVEALFRRALDVAREQEAKSFELRAATSLARLLRDRGRAAEARELLAPLYAWFTEGFGTRDLIEAKTLLDTLR
jgi:class 3 adenylate cyclase/predicted ATPase